MMENHYSMERNRTPLHGHTCTLVCMCAHVSCQGSDISCVSEAPHLGWADRTAVGISGLGVTVPGATFINSGAAEPSGKGAVQTQRLLAYFVTLEG